MAYASPDRRAGLTAHCIAKIFSGLMFAFCWPLAQACELPLNWRADYNVEKYGMTLATISLSLRKQDRDIVYESQTRSTGLLSVLKDEEIIETSRLRATPDNAWQLQSVQQRRKNDPNRYLQYDVQWLDEYVNLHGEVDGDYLAFTLERPVWDRSSAQLALMCELYANPDLDIAVMSVVDDCKPIFHVYQRLKKETVTIGDVRYETVMFERSHNRRSTKLWLAPKLHYLPVKMEQYKDGDFQMRMTLNKYQKSP